MRPRRSPAALFSLAIATAVAGSPGCKATNTTLGPTAPVGGPAPRIDETYEPVTAVQASPTTERAALAYRGDTQALAAALGDVVGTLTVTVPAKMPEEEAHAEAGRRAAARGGTHVMLAADRQTQEKELDEGKTRLRRLGWALGNFGGQERCKNGDMQACLDQLGPPPPAYKTHDRRAFAYVVVAVPPTHWAELPAPLRPTPKSGVVVAATPSADAPAVPARGDAPPSGGSTWPFPGTVAGFTFGISPKEAEALCRSAGGAFVLLPGKGDDKRPSGVCSDQPVKIDIETDGIFLAFCGTSLCEVGLHLGKESGQRLVAQLTSAEKRLAERYGPPNFVTSDVASAVAQCEGNLPVQMQRVWLVRPASGKPGGRIVLGHTCSGATDGGSNVIYQSAEGFAWRSRERDRRNQNY